MKISVRETILTSAGLMRPGIPYVLDLSIPKHALAAEYLLCAGGVGHELADEDAAALLASGVSHYPDDVAAPVLTVVSDDAAAAEAEAKAAADAAAAEAEAKAAADAINAESARKK